VAQSATTSAPANLAAPGDSWSSLAAEQGHSPAQYNLGVIYIEGRSGPQDDVMAHMWLNVAASRSQGEEREQAVGNSDIIAARLTREQIAETRGGPKAWSGARGL